MIGQSQLLGKKNQILQIFNSSILKILKSSILQWTNLVSRYKENPWTMSHDTQRAKTCLTICFETDMKLRPNNHFLWKLWWNDHHHKNKRANFRCNEHHRYFFFKKETDLFWNRFERKIKGNDTTQVVLFSFLMDVALEDNLVKELNSSGFWK